MRVRVTTAAVQKQSALGVCFIFPDLSDCTVFSFINGTIFAKKIIANKTVFWFSLKQVQKRNQLDAV